MGRNWNSITELLDTLNKTCNYIILRNYENISDENYYLEGHDDIDFLCDNQKNMRNIMGARRSSKIISSDHFFIMIRGIIVKVGIRYVGDGYYDQRWEENMLKNRIFNENGFYTMNPKDYYYSLLYHALLQKKKMAEDYKLRLSKMGVDYGKIGHDEKSWLEVLLNFMVEYGYRISAPKDAVVPMRKDIIFKLANSFCKDWNLSYKVGRIPYWMGVKYRVILKSIKRHLIWVKK